MRVNPGFEPPILAQVALFRLHDVIPLSLLDMKNMYCDITAMN